MWNLLQQKDSLRDLEQPDLDLVTREQLAQHGKSTLTAVLSNAVAAIVVSILFSQQLNFWALGGWASFLLGASIYRLQLGKQTQRAAISRGKALRLKRRLTVNAAVYAHIWGVGIACLLTVAQGTQFGLLAVIGAGQISAGTLTYRHLSEASRAWTFIIFMCLAVGLIARGGFESYGTLVLLSMFAAVLNKNGVDIFNGFVNQLLTRQESNRSAETVKLLLNDFEEQSANWLFSMDQDGLLIDVCDRFAEAADRPKKLLEGSKLTALFADPKDRNHLKRKIAKSIAFRDVPIAIKVGDEKHWWTISARATGPSQRSSKVAMRGVIADITAQKSAEEKVNYMAHFDGLTDLPNRRLFNDTLDRTIRNAQDKDYIALAFFDLDHFKGINDTLGHPIGDKLLQAIARRLDHLSHSGDLLARMGGDEFALLLTGNQAKKAEEIAQTIIKKLGMPFVIDGHDISTGVSIGIAHWNAEIEHPDKLLKYADLALYASKKTGRNRLTFFEQGMDIAAENRRAMENDLRQSIGQQEMRLHYQPLVDIKTLQKTGFEALIRWEHPQRGIVMPDEFIGIAEETGLIVQLGEWVIRKAIEDAAAWGEGLNVAVNLSPSQMRAPNLLSTIVNALARTGLQPHRLELEITESVLMQDSEDNIRLLHQLRDLGVRIALDDFGTGYSSLNYLRSFPFDKIKIDRCFVEAIDTHEDCRVIIRSVINLAKNLGMQTTAEGVERQSQVDQLRLEGCDQVQGYLYGKAAHLDGCTDLRSEDKTTSNLEALTPSDSRPAERESLSDDRRKSA
ncbi:MAG: EAL domain-containing protein [Parasphingorhabdus sp.]|uniref:putative bifunctional diguanylate cyclase/phosphodiesterase n=1 Tax=Parasphingorhabdus sp. TaxID=2709688 RepID=UPI003297016B